MPSPLSLLDAAGTGFLDRVVTCARDYLGAHVSFLAEVEATHKVIRHAAGPAAAAGLAPGTRFVLEDTYCHRLLQGLIPEAIYDARGDVRTRDIETTRTLGIEAYIGVPVVLADRRVLGTLCCINFSGDPARRERDVGFMRFLAGLVSAQLDETLGAGEHRRARWTAVREVLHAGGPAMVFQPIVALASGEVVGAEALARFGDGPHAAPDTWFREAWQLGLGAELELAAVRAALPGLDLLPAPAYLAVNASPLTLLHPDFAPLVAPVAARLVIEITEHAAVEDYTPVIAAIERLRAAGVRIAVDDVGAGYSSLRHVLRVAPHIAKLDISLTRWIDLDTVKQALAVGVMAFAARAGLTVVAEGVETAAEADALRTVGLEYAQGYLFARPGALPFPSAAAGPH